VRRVTRLVDDLDGGAATETVRFGLDGIGYELDLSAANAVMLRAVLGRYVDAARRVQDGAARRTRTAGVPAVRAAPRRVAAADGRSGDGPVRQPVPVRLPGPGRRTQPAPVAVQFSDRHAHGTANG